MWGGEVRCLGDALTPPLQRTRMNHQRRASVHDRHKVSTAIDHCGCATVRFLTPWCESAGAVKNTVGNLRRDFATDVSIETKKASLGAALGNRHEPEAATRNDCFPLYLVVRFTGETASFWQELER